MHQKCSFLAKIAYGYGNEGFPGFRVFQGFRLAKNPFTSLYVVDIVVQSIRDRL